MAYDLKPFVINLNDLTYLLAQINFVPLFDGPANSNGIVNFDPLTMDAWDAKGNQIWESSTQSGSYKGTALDANNVALLGHGFPQVSSPIGIRDVTGLHNNLFGTQADWGNVDVPFRRDIAADFTNYVTTPGADYTPGNSVIDYMPRIISKTITTGGVHLLTDAGGHYVNWDAARYISDGPYATLVNSSGVTIANLVEGAKIVAPVTTEIAILDNNGAPLVYTAAAYYASIAYTVSLAVFAATAFGGLKDPAGGTLTEGEAIWYRQFAGGPLVNTGLTYQPDALVYKQLIDANVDFSTGAPADGTAIVNTLTDSGYGLLETLGHIDFQNPTSGEFFIGSENPGVAPVNSWFGIFGQFFDHGLDLIGKGGNGKVTIMLETTDPLYRAPGTLGVDDPGNTKITISRATIAGNDANGDPNYINHTSPFIDQSQTYGSDEQITNLLREWVPNESGAPGYHAGMNLFDGSTLVDAWTRRWPDGSTLKSQYPDGQTVHDTLPTLNELRDHVLDTDRAELTWEDVGNYRNRDANGQLQDSDANTAGVQTTGSGHALILDMNPRFDAAHLSSKAFVGKDIGAPGPADDMTVQLRVEAAVTELSTSLVGSTDYAFTVTRDVGTNEITNIQLDVLSTANSAHLPLGTYYGATALAPWINFSDFSITASDPAIHAAVGEILLATIGDHYIAGDGRVNENFGLTSIHHVFHEEHNYQVENLKSWIYKHDAANSPADHAGLHEWQDKVTPAGTDTPATGVLTVGDHYEDAAGNYVYADGNIAWNADKMFNGTKLIVEMEYQHAAVDQYARTVTPRIQEFVGYSTSVDSTVSLEYSQVAFRFGHSTIRETIDTIDPSGWMLGHVTRYALEKAFLNPQGFADQGAAAITLGLSRQQMNEVDEFITPALNQGLLGQPLDLAAINIARSRDLGIPTLNDFRAGISLARYTSWDDFGKNMIHPESLVNFIAAYSFGGNVALATAAMQNAAFMHNTAGAPAGADGFNHIDSWIGGLAEAHVPGGLLGETFDAVFVAQIQSLMDGDRFYYLYRLFGTQIHEEVNNGQFKDIVERNTGLSHLNGSIFAYADKYYDFNREADGTEFLTSETTATGDHANHLYADLVATNGIFSDGGDSTVNNGAAYSVLASDGVRANQTLNLIKDLRVNAQPDLVHPVEGTPTDGADSHEVIVATDNADFIHARAGDDTVYGEGGDDYIFGDGGVDRLYGGDGNDMLDTGEGPDLADGGAGKDIIYGRGSGSEVGGFDQLVGGSGNDLLIGGEGIDKLSGGSGDDIIYGDGLTNPEMGNTDPFTHGGDGNDYMDGGASGDLLFGEEGDDYIVGGADQDLIQGGQGDDIIRPGAPSQASGTNGGPDEVVGDNGVENSGFDLIDLSDWAGNAAGATVDFATMNNPLVAIDQTAPFPAWFQMEGAIGTSNSDTFIGDSAADLTATLSLGNNWLIGGSGNDTFTGNGGNDLIVGGSIRLDALIGKYSDAANASGPTGALGSAAWLTDAMATGTGGLGYNNNTEDPYSGASNRATGELDFSGLLHAAGMDNLAHFQEMLRSRMFKDVVLGDSAGLVDTGAIDTAVFAGTAANYTIEKVAGFNAYKIVDNTPNRNGTDLVTGVERLKFNGTVTATVAENQTATNVTLATLGAGTTFTLTGADATLFAVDANGALSFLSAPNYEAPTDAGPNNVYDLVVNASNNGVSYSQVVSVAVTDVNEFAVTAPVNALGGAIAVNENAVAGTAIGLTANAVDADGTNNIVTYSLTNNAGGAFAINANTGVVTVANAALLNYETVQSLGITVRATSSDTSFADSNFAVAINNVNEFAVTAPVNALAGAIAVNENVAAGTAINLRASATDGDTLTDTVTYSLTNNPGNAFTINATTGEVTTAATIDFESLPGAGLLQRTVNLTVRATSSDGSTADTVFGVTVNNMDEAGTSALTISNAVRGVGNTVIITAGGLNTVTDPDGFVIVPAYSWRNAANTQIGTGNTLTLTANNAVQQINLAAAYSDAFGAKTATPSAETVFVGTVNDNTINGTSGKDYIFGFGGTDRLNGGAGNDVLDGGSQNNDVAVFGSAVADATFAVSGGNLQVTTSEGTDTLINIERAHFNNLANNTDYRLQFDSTGTANNNFNASNAPELFIGLGGTDTVTYTGGTSINASLATGTATNGDRFYGIENLTGGTGNDTLTGDVNANRLTGGSGSDTLTGGAGSDILDGGNNTDTAVFSSDVISNSFSYNANNHVVVTGAEGADELISIESLNLGGSTFNLFAGTNGNNGNVTGGNGADLLLGFNGNDTLTGGQGADVLVGGEGSDVFVFSNTNHSGVGAALRDVITDFATGDVVDLSGIDANTGNNGNQAFTSVTLTTAAFTAAGQIHYHVDGNGNTIIEGNVGGANGNAADFEIQLNGSHTLTSGNFNL